MLQVVVSHTIIILMMRGVNYAPRLINYAPKVRKNIYSTSITYDHNLQLSKYLIVQATVVDRSF